MINYGLIDTALRFYRARGYEYVEVPWVVSAPADDSSRPRTRRPLVVSGYGPETHRTRLPGSGEQGFAELLRRGRAPLRASVTVTPCFRPEPVEDSEHRPWFLKVELFDPDESNWPHLLADARALFERNLAPMQGLRTEKTTEGADLRLYGTKNYVPGVEVGSYGVRRWRGLRWAYGTGLAEPRFSTALREVSE